MKFKEIKFKDKHSNKIYQDYLSRIQKTTKILDKKGQEEILLEINSHIYEGLMHDSSDSEGEAQKLMILLKKLGPPEVFLKPLVAEKKFDEATRTFNPIKILRALALNIGNGISYVIFSILYFFLSIFVILIFAELIRPDNVGYFRYPDNRTMFGYNSEVRPGDYQYDVLGNWFIPAMLLAAILFYILITIIVRLQRNFKNKLT